MITRSVTLFIMTMSLLLHAVTPLLAQEDEAAEFDLFTDDNGILTIELPASWDDRRFGNWILEDETVGILLETAPDLADFHNGWDTPGMVLGLSTILAEREIGTALIDRYDLSAQCALVETDTSQDEIELTKVAQVHTIHTAIWGECGATTTSVVLLTLIPADNSYLIFVFGQFVEDLDYELAQRATQSIVLNHLDRLPGSTVATPEPTPTPTKRAIRGLTLGRTSTISTTAEAPPITNTVPIETTPTPAGEIDTTEPVTRTIRTNPITLHPIGKGDVLTTTTNTTDTTAITDTATVTTTTAPTTTIIADAPAPNRKPRLGSSHLTLGNDTQTATTDRQTGTTKTTPDPQDAEPDTTADALIEEARALATAGDIDGALARFENALQLDPKLDLDPVAATVDALLSVGIGYYDDGDYATALPWFTAAVDLDPTDVSAHLWRGDANRLLTDYAAAIADYTAGIDLDEPGYDYAGAFNNRGRAYYYSDEFDAAIADFSMAIALAPDYTAAYDLRGSVYHDQQEYAKAVADFTMAITLADADYNYRWAYAYRGRSYAELEQYERAVADFSEAVAIDPTYTWAHEWLGYAYNQLGEYEAAIAAYDAAIALAEEGYTYQYAYANRGRAHAGLNDFEQAVADLSEAIALDSDYTWAYDWRGYAYNELGEHEKAIADLTYMIELADPDFNYTYAYATRGNSYAALGEYDLALADLDAAIALDPDYVWARQEQAHVLGQLGRYADAFTALTTATSIDSENPTTWNSLCWYGALYGFAERVVDGACEETLRLAAAEDVPFYRDSRGVARALAGDGEGALADFQAFLAGVDLDEVGELYERRQEWVERLELGEDSLEIFDAAMIETLRNE